MDNTIKELERLKTSIDESKKQVAVMEGREEESLKRLKEEHGLNSMPAAEKWLEKYKAALIKMEEEIEISFKKLKEEYEW
jgi:hypothetical protein